MVNDLADETKEDLTLAIMDDDRPLVFNPEEEAARTQECEYCGHYPCGCGG